MENQSEALLRSVIEEETKRIISSPFSHFVPTGVIEDFIRTIGQGKYFIVSLIAANGIGKCLDLDAPILMANGEWNKLRDVKVGDMVLGHNYETGKAEPVKVLQTTRAGIKDIYRFTFKDGGYVEASPEHSFPIKLRSGRNSKVNKIRVHKLLERGIKLNSIGSSIKFQSPKVIEFDNKNKLPIDPYLLGVLLGDGCITKNIQISTPDKEIIERVSIPLDKLGLKSITSNNLDYRIILKDFKNSFNFIRENKNKLKEELDKLGLLGCYSGNKFIPDVYKTCSVEERKQLLAGLIDTDGTLNEYLTKSKQLAEDYCFIIKSLGGRATMKERVVNNEFTKGIDKTYYRIYWKFDYKLPLSIDRKQEVSKRPVEYSNRIVKKVEYVGKKDCGDIFIDHEKHCYISYDFVSTGNTYSGINILASLIWHLEKNEWFNYKLFNNWPYLKKIRIVSEPASIVGTIIPTIKEVFPEGRYTMQKRGKNYESYIKTDTGWEIDLMTYDQDPKEFESISVGLVLLDEPPTYKIYTACVSRLRMGGIMLMTLTPLVNAGWIYDKVICNSEGDFGQRTSIEADVWSASKTRGIRGFLNDIDIERMIKEYPEDEAQARIQGKFQHLSGLVYKQWRRDVHTIDPFLVTDKDYIVINMLDPHPRVPDAISWIAIDRYGQKFYIDELKFSGSTSDMAQRIKRIDAQYRVVEHYADPAAFNEDKHQEKSLAKKLEEYGVFYQKAPKQRQFANRRIRDALNYQKVNGEFIVTPEIYVFNTCSNIIYEIEHWIWDEHKGKTADNKNPKGTPIDKDDHYIENLGRALVINPDFFPVRNYIEKTDTSLIEDENHEYDPY